jgi:hypothetical protein
LLLGAVFLVSQKGGKFDHPQFDQISLPHGETNRQLVTVTEVSSPCQLKVHMANSIVGTRTKRNQSENKWSSAELDNRMRYQVTAVRVWH